MAHSGGLSLHRPVGRWEAQMPAQSSQKHPSLAAGEDPGARILHTATLAPRSLLSVLVPQNDCPKCPQEGTLNLQENGITIFSSGRPAWGPGSL